MILPTKFAVDTELLTQAKFSLPSDQFRYTINEPSGNFFYDPWAIKPEFVNTVWAKFLSVLPENIGEARIIVLDPGTCYHSHSDIDDRYHLNISGTNCYLVDLDKNTMYPLINDGQWYDMDASPRHSAVNFGATHRIQLVVRKLLSRNILTDSVRVTLTTDLAEDDARYLFDNQLSSILNRINKQKLISNFSYQGRSVSFEIERKNKSLVETMAPPQFKITYND